MRYVIMFALFFSTTLVAQDMRNIPTFDVDQFQEQKTLLIGKVVRIQFDSRSPDIGPGSDNKYCSSRLHDSKKFHDVDVRFPREHLVWFNSIPEQYASRRVFVLQGVIGRVESLRSDIFIDLLGQEVRNDMVSGTKIVWTK